MFAVVGWANTAIEPIASAKVTQGKSEKLSRRRLESFYTGVL